MAVLSKIKASDNVDYNIRDDYSIWGGRNLIKGSNKLSTASNMYGWINNGNSTTLEVITENGIPVIHMKGNVTEKWIPSITTRQKINLEWGQVYILSCDIKVDKAITIASSVPQHYWAASMENDNEFDPALTGKGAGVSVTSYVPAANVNIAANTWQHYERIFTTAASAPNSSYPYPGLRPFIYGSVRSTSESVEVNVWTKNWKLEKGNKSTDWSPAPEDIARFIGDETIELYSE